MKMLAVRSERYQSAVFRARRSILELWPQIESAQHDAAIVFDDTLEVDVPQRLLLRVEGEKIQLLRECNGQQAYQCQIEKRQRDVVLDNLFASGSFSPKFKPDLGPFVTVTVYIHPDTRISHPLPIRK